MIEVKTENIRNIGFVGHGGSGKTSFVDGLLFAGKSAKRLGKVEDGTSISDYNQDEIDRKISISASFSHCFVKDVKVNILDMPGYSDFIGEVVSGLRVCDMAVIVVNAKDGIEVGTEMVSKYAVSNGIPRMIVFNKLDKENLDFDNILSSAREHRDKGIIPVETPVNTGPDFNTVIDLLKLKMITYKNDDSGAFDVFEIPAEHKDEAQDLHEKIIEAAAESDDDLLEIYFENGELTPEEFETGFKKGLLSGSIIPAMCAVATHNYGPKQLLNFVVKHAPSPAELSPVKGIDPNKGDDMSVEIDDSKKTSAFIFKTVSEMHLGELSFFKVFSGAIKSGQDLQNTTSSNSERIGQIYRKNY